MATLAFEKSFGKWMEAEKELFNECEAYIKSQLELMPSNEIEIDYGHVSSIPTVICEAFEVCVKSNVERVYLKQGNIYIDTDFFSWYSASLLTAKELFDIAVAVKGTIEANFEFEQ